MCFAKQFPQILSTWSTLVSTLYVPKTRGGGHGIPGNECSGAQKSAREIETPIHCCIKLQKVYFNFELQEAFGTALTPVINDQKPWVERKQVWVCVCRGERYWCCAAAIAGNFSSETASRTWGAEVGRSDLIALILPLCSPITRMGENPCWIQSGWSVQHGDMGRAQWAVLFCPCYCCRNAQP